MNTNIFKLAAALAWAGVAVSSATPADASLITSQTGSYATCHPDTQTVFGYLDCPLALGEPEPFSYNYKQTIRFISVGCNAGGCSTDTTWVYTDTSYGTGRKTTSVERSCRGTTLKIYGLGTCAC
jgi:hypothetical protein